MRLGPLKSVLRYCVGTALFVCSGVHPAFAQSESRPTEDANAEASSMSCAYDAAIHQSGRLLDAHPYWQRETIVERYGADIIHIPGGTSDAAMSGTTRLVPYSERSLLVFRKPLSGVTALSLAVSDPQRAHPFVILSDGRIVRTADAPAELIAALSSQRFAQSEKPVHAEAAAATIDFETGLVIPDNARGDIAFIGLFLTGDAAMDIEHFSAQFDTASTATSTADRGSVRTDNSLRYRNTTLRVRSDGTVAHYSSFGGCNIEFDVPEGEYKVELLLDGDAIGLPPVSGYWHDSRSPAHNPHMYIDSRKTSITNPGDLTAEPGPSYRSRIAGALGFSAPHTLRRWDGGTGAFQNFSSLLFNNSQGVHDADFIKTKTEGCIRVAYVGQSVVEGIQVNLQNKHSKLLSMGLSDRLGRCINVYTIAAGYHIGNAGLVDRLVNEFDVDAVMFAMHRPILFYLTPEHQTYVYGYDLETPRWGTAVVGDDGLQFIDGTPTASPSNDNKRSMTPDGYSVTSAYLYPDGSLPDLVTSGLQTFEALAEYYDKTHKDVAFIYEFTQTAYQCQLARYCETTLPSPNGPVSGGVKDYYGHFAKVCDRENANCVFPPVQSGRWAQDIPEIYNNDGHYTELGHLAHANRIIDTLERVLLENTL